MRDANIPGSHTPIIPVVCSLFMLVVGLLACLEPTLRALRIQPAEALSEG